MGVLPTFHTKSSMQRISAISRQTMQVLDIVIQGILLGGLYALYAAGLSLIFGVMRLVNLAHGDLIVLAAYLLLALSTGFGLPLPFALIIALPFFFALGYALQSVLFNRSLGAQVLPALLVSFGLSIIVQNGVLELFSADSRKLSLSSIDAMSIDLAGISVGVLPLATFFLAVLLLGSLSWVFYRTPLGRILRATSDSAEIAQLMGINPRRVFAIAMGLSFIVIVLAALCMGLRANFDPSAGPARLLYAFEAVVIGGLGSLWGTLVGGIVLGIPQALGGAIDTEWQVLTGHLVFLCALLLRPAGLFPRQVQA
jgi:branched-chain amino acid transport system permease protein